MNDSVKSAEAIEKMNLQEFTLYVDSLTTAEFCDWQGIKHPYFTGDVKSSADLFLQIDTIKWRICKEKAKQQAKLSIQQSEELNKIEAERKTALDIINDIWIIEPDDDAQLHISLNPSIELIEHAMRKFASLAIAEKEKEIEELKTELAINEGARGGLDTRARGAENAYQIIKSQLSQQKDMCEKIAERLQYVNALLKSEHKHAKEVTNELLTQYKESKNGNNK